MTRVAVLRAGYGAIALAFVLLGLVVAVGVGFALPLGFLLALAGATLFLFSGDDLPRWAGLGLVAYFLVSVFAFFASTPITIRLEAFSGFVNSQPSPMWTTLFQGLLLALPLMLGGAAVAAAWERDPPARILLMGAVAGFLLFAALNLFLQPSGSDPAQVAASAESQAGLLRALFAVSALAATVGSAWSAARAEG